MADYVAGANRNLESFKVNTIKKHSIVEERIQDSDLIKIFNVPTYQKIYKLARFKKYRQRNLL